MYANNTTNEEYPKTLVIRNTVGGCIWQVYHVPNVRVAKVLSDNATRHGFYGITLEDHQPDKEETFPQWREEAPDLLTL